MHYTNKRNNANTENIDVRDLGQSAFDLSHKTKDSGRIGRRELVGYEFVMPGDRMRLNSQFDLQFQPTSVNMLPAMDMRIEHVFIPFRVVNRDFADMSSFVEGDAWLNETFAQRTLSSFVPCIQSYTSPIWSKTLAEIIASPSLILSCIPALQNALTPYFIGDYAVQLEDHLNRLFAGYSDMTDDAKQSTVLQATYDLFCDFIGRGSYLDRLNVPIITKNLWFTWPVLSSSTFGGFLTASCSNFDCMPINEMVLRSLYCDWFETTRDSILEPAKSLPRYHNFGNSAVDVNILYFCCLVPRYALLGKDIFTTANTDSPYRKVLAPITNSPAQRNALNDGVSSTAQSFRAPYLSAGPTTSIITAMSNDSAISAFGVPTSSSSTLGLDLVALKRAKMARSWLLRGHVFGDEYQDFLLAQYGVKLSDNRVNKPWRLGGYSKQVNIDTTTNATATSVMPAGAKNCTMTTSGGTENKEFFSEEAGIVFTWAYLVPAVTYMPYDVRHTIKLATDIPQPVFANQSEELSFACEISRNCTNQDGIYSDVFGRHPYAHAWRGRVDENHGMFLDDYLPMTFCREFDSTNLPVLNSAFIHCHVNLDFMVDSDSWNPIYFGTFSHNVGVVRNLPVVTDEC